MSGKGKSGREQFKQYMEDNLPYLKRSLEKKRAQQQEKADKGGPNEVGALDSSESLQVSAYAIFYAAEDLRESSVKLEILTWVLMLLSVIVAVSTVVLTTR